MVDVGTGPGLLLHHLADRGARLHGVDPSEPMVDIARRAAEGAGLAYDFRFVRMAATATALRGRFAEVSRKPVRLLFARLAAR